MGYGRGDCFPFDFEPNGTPFGSENRMENCHPDHIPFNVKGNRDIVFSVCGMIATRMEKAPGTAHARAPD